jgi:hypothetical protein
MAHVIKPNVAPYYYWPPGVNVNQPWLAALLMLKSGWKYKASSGGGAKDVSNDPRNNKYGAPVVTGAGGSAAAIGAKTGYDVLITGLSSMTVPSLTNQGGSEGRYLVLGNCLNAGNNTIFQISQVVSTTSVMARPVITPNSAIASDPGATGTNTITWTEYDPATVTYNASWPNNPYWIVLRGPSMLRMTFSAAPTPNDFVRGEKVTQPGTGAEGEVIGVTYDPNTGAGWAVIAPRVAGTGGGALGWSIGSALLGASSGAGLTPTAILEHVTEVTMGATYTDVNTRSRGAFFMWVNPGVALDGGVEQAMLASTIASSSACTYAVAPGGSGRFPSVTLANNGFPYLAFSPIGNICDGVNNTNWFHITDYNSNSNYPGNMHFVATNCIERAGVSADGTFWMACGAPNTGPQVYHGWGFFRCDDSEEGDVWPYVFYASRRSIYDGAWWDSTNYRYGTTGTDSQAEGPWMPLHVSQDINRPSWWTWRARGMEVGSCLTTGSNPQIDRFKSAVACFLFNEEDNISAYQSYGQDPEKVAACAYPSLVREHPVIVSWYPAAKFRKGRPRWLAIIQGNQASDTYGNRSWFQGRDTSPADYRNYQAIILGPWDGSTTPIPY